MIEITTRSSIRVKPRRVDRPAMAFLLVIRSAINSGFGCAVRNPPPTRNLTSLVRPNAEPGNCT